MKGDGHGNTGRVVTTARARVRWHKVRDMSDAGATKAEAAAATGLTMGGLDSLLNRNVGSAVWPIQEGNPT